MPKGHPITFTSIELRRMRAAVEAHEDNLSAIASRFGVGIKRLRALIKEHGWRTDKVGTNHG